MNAIKEYLRNWRDHPIFVTVLGSIIIGFCIRLYTEIPTYRPSTPISQPTSVATPNPVTPGYNNSSVVASSTPLASPPAINYNNTSNYRAPSSRTHTSYTFTIDNIPYRLDNEESFNHLSAMKRQAESLSVSVAAYRIQCNSLSSQIDRCNAELNSLKYTLDRTNQYAIDSYNSKVGTVNEYVQTYRLRVAELNLKIDEYNSILESMKVYANQHRRY